MTSIPKESGFDHSLAFLAEGYDFITHRCRQFNSGIFATRLLGKTYYCVRGAEAAAMFYEPDRFTRRGGLPNSVLHLLQDEGSAVLDSQAHRHRKAMMMSLMGPDRLGEIASLARQALRDHVRALVGRGPVSLHDADDSLPCGLPLGRARTEGGRTRRVDRRDRRDDRQRRFGRTCQLAGADEAPGRRVVV